ncbi:MAG: hypothetical protein RLZZ455_771 [Candidatus Parcubacteria bacterium]|jgi:hypothetical protein
MAEKIEAASLYRERTFHARDVLGDNPRPFTLLGVTTRGSEVIAALVFPSQSLEPVTRAVRAIHAPNANTDEATFSALKQATDNRRVGDLKLGGVIVDLRTGMHTVTLKDQLGNSLRAEGKTFPDAVTEGLAAVVHYYNTMTKP